MALKITLLAAGVSSKIYMQIVGSGKASSLSDFLRVSSRLPLRNASQPKRTCEWEAVKSEDSRIDKTLFIGGYNNNNNNKFISN